MPAPPALAAARLALRWHARTATLVTVVTILALVGTLPALALLGDPAAPMLRVATPDLAALREAWAGGVTWPVLQASAVTQLTGLVRGAALLVLAVGILTLLALHVARAGARHGEVVVARAVGATRRTVIAAALAEAAALALVACIVALVASVLAGVALRNSWPGTVAAAAPWRAIAALAAIAATCLAAPLLLARAVTTSRLVDDDRRPLTLHIPALQLGAAVVVLAGARLVARALDVTTPAPGTVPAVQVATIADGGTDRLARARRLAALLDRVHAASPSRRISLTTPGTLLGLGTSHDVLVDCGGCSEGGFAVRYRVAPAVHHVVSGDTFALAGLPLVAGRTLGDGDRWDAPLAVVISASMARGHFGGDAVGRRVRLPLLGGRWFTVVGVVADAPVHALGAAMQPRYAVYVSVLQHPVARLEVATVAPLADAMLAPVGSIVQRDALTRRAATLRAPVPWVARLLAIEGVVALCIALGGVLVMLRLWLDSQRREFGIRMAVGASRRTVQRLVLVRAAIIAVAGGALGAWGGPVAWDVLPRILPGAPMWDASLVASTAGALGMLVLLVAWWTAVRFTALPPVVLLQADGE